MSRNMSLWLREETKAQPPGMTSYGAGGGPAFSDAFRSRRAPSLPALAEAFKSIIYTCVGINADAVARVPLRLMRVGRSKGDTAKYCEAAPVSKAVRMRLRSLPETAKAMAGAEEVEEIVGDHPLLKLINDVNPSMDHTQLIQSTVMSMDVVGTAFWWPTAYTQIGPGEIWPLPPHLVYPIMSGTGMVPEAYQFGSVQYSPEDLLIFKQLSMKNFYGLGMSPTQAAIEYAKLEDSFISVADDMISNGPRPSIVVSHRDPKGAFGEAERKRLDYEMNQKSRGGRSGSAVVVDGAVTVAPISYTPADLGALETSKHIIEMICGCFRIPVSMITNESSNRAVADSGLVQHARQAVEPRCKAIASTLTRWTHALDRTGARNWSKLFWVFDDCVPEDEMAKAELATKYVQMGWPINAALTDSGRDAVEGGDVSFVASNLTTLENAVKPPEPPVLPGQEPGEDPDDKPPGGKPKEDESKAIDAEIAEVLGSVRTKLALLPDAEPKGMANDWVWDATLKRYVPCRDESGRFASCDGAGGAKPKKPGKKPAKKPREPKPAAPKKPKEPAKPKEPKPAPAPKPAKEPKKPAEPKPPKEAKPKPEKPAKEKPKPAEKPAETNFGPSGAKVQASMDLTPAQSKAQLDKAKRILGPKATDADIASVVGAPENARVIVADAIFGHPDSISIYVNAPGMQALRRIDRLGGDLVVRNDSFHVEKTGTGLGAKVFGRQVEQAARLGATKITTLAARGPGMNGYITWPKLGYDAPIPGSVIGKLPASLKSAKNLSDLMKTKAGTEWWTQHGITTDMTFDLKPNSPSRKHLAKYLKAKGYGQ